MIGSTELIIIALVVFVLFGSAAIPKFAKSLGLAKNEFEKGLKEDKDKDTNKDKKDSASDLSDKA